MAQSEIKYTVSINTDGTLKLGFDNLNKGDARALLITLNRLQLYRAAGIDTDDAEGYSPTSTEKVGAALGVDPFPKAAAVTGGPRFVTKPAHFDHTYEPGAFGACKRCGGEKH